MGRLIERASNEEVLQTLGRFPSVVAENNFREDGLVETSKGLRVPVYVAQPLGFDYPGRRFLNTDFYPSLQEVGVLPLCPFKAGLEFESLVKYDPQSTIEEHVHKWRYFNTVVLPLINFGILMPRSPFFTIALLEGNPEDSGTVLEIGASIENSVPVIGIRSDFRSGENIGSRGINPAVLYPLSEKFGSTYFHAPENQSYTQALVEIEKRAKQILTQH